MSVGRNLKGPKRAAWLFAALLTAISPITANPLLTVASGITVPVIVLILWRPGEPPVLLLLAMLHWLQAAMRVFHADALGTSVNDYTIVEQAMSGPSITPAVWLTLLSVVALSFGLRLGTGARTTALVAARKQASLVTMERVAVFYVLAVMAAGVLDFIRVGGLAQIIHALQYLRYGALFILGYVALSQKRGVSLLLAAAVFEVLTGLTGFFSDFRLALFVLLLVIVTVRPTLSPRNAVLVALVVCFTAYLAIIWTAVKEEYREYLSGGQQAQVVTVAMTTSLRRFGELAVSLDGNALKEGVEALAERIAYVDYFGFVIHNVPRNYPHEDGAVWLGSLEHILKPRILFPGKPPLESQTDVTRRYAGVSLYAAGPNSSISIGYPGLSYVDFGVPWMLAPILLLGWAWGLMYRHLVCRQRLVLLGFGIAVALFLPAMSVESSPTQLVGGTVMAFIVSALLLRFGGSIVWSWLAGPPGRAVPTVESS